MEKTVDYDGAVRILQSYGDFHDAYITSLRYDFVKKKVEVHLDNLWSGLPNRRSAAGHLAFYEVEYLLSRFAYAGGELRMESLELAKMPNHAFKMTIHITTTKWYQSPEFAELLIEIVASKMGVAKVP